VSVSTRKRRRERGPARAQLPVPLSNLTKLSKRGALHPAQTKVPLRFSLSSGEEPGVVFRSAELRRTKYWPGVRTVSHSFCFG